MKTKIRQQSVASLPSELQDGAMSDTEQASEEYPSIELPTGQRLHVFRMRGGEEWEIWINFEGSDFTGLCVSVAKTRLEAVTEAIKVFSAAIVELQKPFHESAQPCGCDPGANWICEAHR